MSRVRVDIRFPGVLPNLRVTTAADACGRPRIRQVPNSEILRRRYPYGFITCCAFRSSPAGTRVVSRRTRVPQAQQTRAACPSRGLLNRIRQRIGDRKVLALLKAFINVGVLGDTDSAANSVMGTPQDGITPPTMLQQAVAVPGKYRASAPTPGPWRQVSGHSSCVLSRHHRVVPLVRTRGGRGGRVSVCWLGCSPSTGPQGWPRRPAATGLA
jgi:hypothetical protein